MPLSVPPAHINYLYLKVSFHSSLPPNFVESGLPNEKLTPVVLFVILFGLSTLVLLIHDISICRAAVLTTHGEFLTCEITISAGIIS